MKIRKKLALKFTATTALILIGILSFIFLFSKENREKEFFRDLTKEAITKANLFLEDRVDAETMQSIYLNNREFINEVEVAIYNDSEQLLYHDAIEIDIVKETPTMIHQIKKDKTIEFYTGKYQTVGLLYTYKNRNYIITAAAYDGYGYIKLTALAQILVLSFMLGLAILFIAGYYFAKSALFPFSKIVHEAESISATSLGKRINIEPNGDELGELAASFNSMLHRLEAAFDSQQQFVNNVSHELKTPMAALITELEVALLKDRSINEYKKALGLALNDAQNINKLSEDLLTLARTNYLPEKIAMRAVRIDEVLLDATSLVLKANPSYSIHIHFEEELTEEVNITVYGNEYLLKTAFVNLIENNCKFSTDKSSSISISFNHRYSIIQFKDNGPGIASEDLKHILKPFFRSKTHNATKGHGIGMALCANIVRTHKGILDINSKLNSGTIFTVSIPHM